MSYESFKEIVTDNLALYNKWGAGKFKKYDKKYPYIANIEGKQQKDVVFDIIKSTDEEVEVDLFQKPHQFAHHLNSSQVMCYCFFRPMIEKDSQHPNYGLAKEKLVEFIQKMIGVNISKGAKCQFEYEDSETMKSFKEIVKNKGKGEKSQFDFYIQDGEIEIYFEIKYTEPSFGKWPNKKNNTKQSINNHCTYVEKGYKEMLKRSPFFTQDCKDFITAMSEDAFSKPNNPFNKHYQLFRNALKADKSRYSVFIFPKGNPSINNELELFRKNLVNNDHIIALYWEDLKSYMSQGFFKKYVGVLTTDKTNTSNNHIE